MDKHDINFVMMLKGNKKLVDKLILKNKGTFENKRSCSIYEYGVYGITVKSKLYETDKTERYFHIFYSIDKESAERSEIEYKLNKIDHQEQDIHRKRVYSKHLESIQTI